MANPRLEDGYLRVANELVEQFYLCDFNKREYMLLWYVMRESFGRMSRKSCVYNAQEWYRATGLAEESIRRTVKDLLAHRVLFGPKPDDLKRGDAVGLQIDYSLWTVDRRTPDNSSDRDKTSRKSVTTGTNHPENRDEISPSDAADPTATGTKHPEKEDETSRNPVIDDTATGTNHPENQDETSRFQDEISRSTPGDSRNDAGFRSPKETINNRQDLSPPLTGGAGGGGKTTRLGLMSPHLDAAIAAGLRDTFEGEVDFLAHHFFPQTAGSFRKDLTLKQAEELAAYFAFPVALRAKAWAYALEADDIRNPYRYALAALRDQPNYQHVFNPTPRPAGPARTPATATPEPLSDAEKARRYTL